MKRFSIEDYIEIDDATEVVTSDVDIEELLEESMDDIQSMERTALVLESLIDLHEAHSASTSVSLEHMASIKIALEMATAGTMYRGKDLVPGSINWSDNISLEDLETSIENNIKNLNARLLATLDSFGKNLVVMGTFMDSEADKLASFKKKLASDGVKNATITVPGSKYLLRNDELVKDIDSYVKAFDNDMATIGAVAERCGKFQNDNFLQGLRTLIAAFSDKKYMELFEDRAKFIDDIIKIGKLHKPTKPIVPQLEADQYVSDFMLGMVYIYATKSSYKSGDIESYKRIESYFHIEVASARKYDKAAVKHSIQYNDIDKKHIEALLKRCELLNEQYRTIIGFRSKIAQLGSISTTLFSVASSGSGNIAIAGVELLKMLVKNYRLLLSTCYIIIATASTSFSAAKGNMKFAEGIISKAIF